MKSKNFWGVLGLVFLLSLDSGCALFLVGAGVAGGIAISKDTIEGVTDKSFDRVYNKSKDVLKQEGFLKTENRTTGILEAEVRKSQVKVEVQKVSHKTVRFRVTARQSHNLMPNMDLANEIYNKIFQKIR